MAGDSGTYDEDSVWPWYPFHPRNPRHIGNNIRYHILMFSYVHNDLVRLRYRYF